MTVFLASLVVFLLCIAGMLANGWVSRKRDSHNCLHCGKGCGQRLLPDTEDQVK